MTLDELIKKLGLEGDNAETLKKFVSAKDGEIETKVGELKVMKAAAKADKAKLKEAEEKAEKICDALGIDIDDEDHEGAIETALKGKSADPALQKQIDKLKGKIKDQETEHSKQFAEERGKRIDGMKRTALLEALAANDADDPALLVDMLIHKIVVSDTDETMTFNDDKNSKIGDYVKEFLGVHPKLVANSQKPGAGSLLGNAGGGKAEDTDFAKKLAESNNTNAETTAKALESYFG